MFSFIFPVTHWLFSTVLFTLHVFVFFSNFFLVADIWSYTVVVSKDAWYNFSLLNWNLFVVADKVLYSQSYGFSGSHVWMWSESCSVVSDSLQCHGLYSWTVGILQARIREWVTIPFSRGSFQPRDRTQVFPTAGGFFTSWATREAHEYWSR